MSGVRSSALVFEGGDVFEFADRMAEAERIAHFGVWRWDVGAGTVVWSDELHRLYGLAPGEFAGTLEAFVGFLHPDDRERVQVNVERAATNAEPFVFEERIIRADGVERVLLSQGRPMVGDDGRVTALVGVCRDVTESVEARRALGHSELRTQAIVDNSPSLVAVKDLEGRYLMANAETARILGVSPAEIIGKPCHELFPTIAAQMRANDHQAIAESEAVYDEAELLVGDELRSFVTVTFPLPDAGGRVAETCTIATDVTERKEREAERRERREWAHRIRSALAADRMLVYAQPVFDLRTGAQESGELLVRMRDDRREGEILLPGAFLPQAERFGVVQEIDVWMVRQALIAAEQFAPEVNLSAVTLCDPDARREIVALLRGAPEAARRIVFEITETASPEHLDAAEEFAGDLVAIGCGLSLDDFGTGFASFTYLRRLPLRYLKIDVSFVAGVLRSLHDQHLVDSIVHMGRQFGLRVIAEGVEDSATLELLRRLGVDYAQGFHLGRPAPLRLVRAPSA